jgi:hypothetical protein
MRQRKSHIAPLAFLMLILFVSPITVKAVHHHVQVQISVPDDSHGKSVSASVSACPVCQFEFVTFIAYGLPDFSPFCQPSSSFPCEAIFHSKGISFDFCSLRAPPLS